MYDNVGGVKGIIRRWRGEAGVKGAYFAFILTLDARFATRETGDRNEAACS